MPNEEPQGVVEEAADAAFRAVEECLAKVGGTIGTLYVALHALNVDTERDSVVAATGDDLPADINQRGRDLFAFLISEAQSTGAALGLQVHIVPMPGFHRG